MGTGKPPWPSASFQVRHGHQVLLRVTTALDVLRICCLPYKAPR
jgi:hypothetical protein